ncbi:MAG: lysylphosphatidylglycerol synthase domain-containing protein [Gammaproteobacteria bacterium]|nr:lysylphosphatidylglycerol synthase domain-containing protein [Gammaproteobacteria bacterium]
MKLLTRIGLTAGLLLLVCLLIWQGVMDVVQLLVTSGWGLLWLPLAWLPNFLPATYAWWLLFKREQSPNFMQALLAMWMGRSVNNLLPVATIGGEVAKARLVSLWACKGTDASASVIVDKTVQVLAVLVWGLAGVSLLLSSSLDDQLALIALAGFAVLALCVTGFFMFQKAGMIGILTRLGGKLIKTDSWEGISLSAETVDATVLEIYNRKTNFVLAVCFKVMGLVLQTAEVWLACYLLGHPIGLVEALMLKSLTSTLSDVAFVIPNAYGIQEGAFIVIGALIGLTPDVSLAVSLAIRIKDLVFDPAGLLTLHQIESKQLLQRSNAA